MKLRIVKPKRFILSIFVISCIIFVFSVLFTNTSFSHGEIQYKEVYITKGDTLWSLSRKEEQVNKLYEGKDIRYIISEIKKVNGMDGNTNLQIGQKIKVPYL